MRDGASFSRAIKIFSEKTGQRGTKLLRQERVCVLAVCVRREQVTKVPSFPPRVNDMLQKQCVCNVTQISAPGGGGSGINIPLSIAISCEFLYEIDR